MGDARDTHGTPALIISLNTDDIASHQRPVAFQDRRDTLGTLSFRSLTSSFLNVRVLHLDSHQDTFPRFTACPLEALNNRAACSMAVLLAAWLHSSLSTRTSARTLRLGGIAPPDRS